MNLLKFNPKIHLKKPSKKELKEKQGIRKMEKEREWQS